MDNFIKYPQLFYNPYEKENCFRHARPNTIHEALASLEDKKEVTIITTNIDGLHQMAGSKKVIELKGNVHEFHCMECKKEFEEEEIQERLKKGIPKCSCGGLIRPNLVFYDEAYHIEECSKAFASIYHCDVLVVIGVDFKEFLIKDLFNYPSKSKRKNVVIDSRGLPCDARADIIID